MSINININIIENFQYKKRSNNCMESVKELKGEDLVCVRYLLGQLLSLEGIGNAKKGILHKRISIQFNLMIALDFRIFCNLPF